MHGIQALQMHLLDTSHSVVRMKSFLEAQRRCAGIPTNELQLKLGTKRDAMDQPKFPRPPAPRLLIALGKHAYGDSAFVLTDGLDLPGFGASESVRWSLPVIYVCAEPGKADRDASSDRLAFLPVRFRAYKEHLIVARGLPGRHVGAMEVDLAPPERTCNPYTRQSPVAFTHFGHPRNSKPVVQVCRD